MQKTPVLVFDLFRKLPVPKEQEFMESGLMREEVPTICSIVPRRFYIFLPPNELTDSASSACGSLAGVCCLVRALLPCQESAAASEPRSHGRDVMLRAHRPSRHPWRQPLLPMLLMLLHSLLISLTPGAAQELSSGGSASDLWN